jgi:hypothetical protein
MQIGIVSIGAEGHGKIRGSGEKAARQEGMHELQRQKLHPRHKMPQMRV